MGMLLLPEGPGGRGFLFSFSQLARGLPGPTPAVSGGPGFVEPRTPVGYRGFALGT